MNNCKDCAIKLYKKDSHICTDCKETCCGKHIYFYVDESNRAITKNSPPLCKECYIKRYK